MGKIVKIFAVLALIVECYGEFPPGIKKCHYGDSECIRETAMNIIQTYPGGLKEINLGSIDPLYYEKIDLKKESNGPLSLRMAFRNINVHGFSQAKILKIDGFTKDPQKIQIHFTLDTIKVLGNYKLGGHILYFPMNGEGKCNNTMLGWDFHWNATVKLVERDNEKYLKVENYRTRFTTTRMYFNFENLFGEDKALSRSANDFFNDQWQLFWDEMKPLLFKMSGKFFTGIFSQPFTEIPYRELFLEDSASEATENL